MISAMAEPATIVVPDREHPAQPFRGIAPFRFIDEPIFFGRMAESQRLLRLVTMFRGVLLFGDSGSGKSSLLNARFLPGAITDGFLPERIRVQPKKGAEIVVERISVRDNARPPFLPSNLAAGDESPRLVLSCEQLREQISRPGSQGYPLLIFDQFEEFVTLFEVAPRTAEERAEAAEAQQRLLDLLAEFLVGSEVEVKLLFAFREDYFTKLQKLFVRCRDLMDQSLRLLPPSIDELPQTIRGPFEKNPGMFANPLSPAVCERLETELRERSSGGLQNPTEGQIAGLMLWQATDRETLLATRKVQGLLEDYLVQQLQSLHPGEHASAVALLSCLVTDAGTRNIVSRSDLIARVTESESINEEAVSRTLDALVTNTGLVREEFRDRTPFYQIISEFLVPWIHSQKAERARIEAERTLARERLEAQGRLEAERREAEQKLALERAEADRLRLKALAEQLRIVRRGRAFLAALVLLLIFVAWRAYLERNNAKIAQAMAVHEKELANEAGELAMNGARTALEQNALITERSVKRLHAAVDALGQTHQTAQSLLLAMTTAAPPQGVSDGEWNSFLQQLRNAVSQTETDGEQIATSAEDTKREAAAVRTVPGWSIYGRLDEHQSWTERYFDNTASKYALAEPGSVIVADTFVNVRKAPNNYDQEKQTWENQQIIGVIATGQRIKVAETRKITGPPNDPVTRLWIRGEPAPQ